MQLQIYQNITGVPSFPSAKAAFCYKILEPGGLTQKNPG